MCSPVIPWVPLTSEAALPDDGIHHYRALYRHEGQVVRGRLSGRLHPRQRRRQATVHRSGSLHRLRRMRFGVPGRGDLRRLRRSREVESRISTPTPPTTRAEPVVPVVVRDARKTYPAADAPVRALDGVSLEVAAARWSRWSDRAAAERARCSTWSAASICPTSGSVLVDGRVHDRPRRRRAHRPAPRPRRDDLSILQPAAGAARSQTTSRLPLVLQRLPTREIARARRAPPSPRSGSATRRAPIRPSSRAANCSARRSRARSSTGRRSCSPTSRPATSTRTNGENVLAPAARVGRRRSGDPDGHPQRGGGSDLRPHDPHARRPHRRREARSSGRSSGAHLRANTLRAAVTVLAVALGVAIALAIDLANATAVASFASSVNVVSNHVNLQVLGVGRGFDDRTLLRVQNVPGVLVASPAIEDSLIVGARAGRPVLGRDLARARASICCGRCRARRGAPAPPAACRADPGCSSTATARS